MKNPHTIGAQEGTFDYTQPPELWVDNGESTIVKEYDEKYKDKRTASTNNKRYIR